MHSASDPPDYYSVIGVSANADEEEIRAAYRARARQLHPDMGGSADEMRLLNGAYEVLSDRCTRSAYDSQRIICFAEHQEPFTPLTSVSCSTENRYSRHYHQRIWWLVLGADCSLFLGLYFVMVSMEPEITRSSVQSSLSRVAAVLFLLAAALFLYRYQRTNRS